MREEELRRGDPLGALDWLKEELDLQYEG